MVNVCRYSYDYVSVRLDEYDSIVLICATDMGDGTTSKTVYALDEGCFPTSAKKVEKLKYHMCMFDYSIIGIVENNSEWDALIMSMKNKKHMKQLTTLLELAK